MSEYCERYLVEGRKWIGRETSVVWGRYPVEREPIRRWCHMVNCLNPLYLDEEYARKTRWGTIIAPPLLVRLWADAGGPLSASGPEIDWPPPDYATMESLYPPTPGIKAINLGGGWEFFEVIRPGDYIGSKVKLTDFYIKPMRYDIEAFWTAGLAYNF